MEDGPIERDQKGTTVCCVEHFGKEKQDFMGFLLRKPKRQNFGKRFLHSPKQSQTFLSQTGLVHKEFQGLLWMFPWKLVEHQHLAHPPAARAARVRPSMLYRNKSKS